MQNTMTNGMQRPMQEAPMRNGMQGNRPNDPNAIFVNYLSNLPRPLGGWQATFPQQQRLGWLTQLYTMILKCSNPQNNRPTVEETTNIIRSAIQYERDIFSSTADAAAYSEGIKSRMITIQNMSQSQRMRPPPFMQQHQQQQNNMLPNGMNLQQNRAQDPRMQNHGLSQQTAFNQAPGQQFTQNNQPMGNGGQPMHGQPHLTTEDRMQLDEIKQRMINQIKSEGRGPDLQRQIMSMPAEQRDKLGKNPVVGWVLQRALAELYRRKAQPDGFNNIRVNQQAPIGNNQFTTPNTTRPGMNFDPSQFAAFQEQAMRSEASGDMVVPASNNNQLPNGQPAPNRRAVNQGGQGPAQPGGQPRNAGFGQNLNQNQGSDLAAARAARAQMIQTGQPPQRTPQQERLLEGQGLHSSQHQMPSPMSTLNRPHPLSNNQQKTPVNNNAMPVGSHQQFTPQGDEPPSIRDLSPQYKAIFQSLPEQHKAQIRRMPVQNLRRALEGLAERRRSQLAQNSNQPSQQQAIQDFHNPARPPQMGQDQRQRPNMDQMGLRGPHMQQPNPNAPPTQNVPSGFPNGFDIHAMALPRAMIKEKLPGLQIPSYISSWANLMVWIKELAGFPPDQMHMLLQIQKFQAGQELRKRGLISGPGPNTGPNRPVAPVDNTQAQDSAYLATPQIDLLTLQQRELVRTGFVPVDNNNLPRMPRVTPQDVQTLRANPKAAGQTDATLVNVIRTNKIKRVQMLDEPLWREIRRVEMNLQNAAARQAGQPPNMRPPLGVNNQGIPNQPGQNMNQPQMDRPGPTGQNQNSRPAGSTMQNGVPQPNNMYHDFNDRTGLPAPTQAQWTQMTPEQQQREKQRLSAMQARGQQQQTSTMPQNPAAPETLSNADAYKRFYDEALTTRPLETMRQVDPAQAQQYQREFAPYNPSHFMGKFIQCAQFFFSKNRTNPAALQQLRSKIHKSVRLGSQGWKVNQYSISIEELRLILSELQGFIDSTFALHQALQAQAQGQPPPVAPAQNGQVQEQARPPPHPDSRSDVPPQAPTTEKPPMTFERPGSQTSPHGTPRLYGNNKFDASKISIPEKRKRKQDTGSEEPKATPTLPQAQPRETGQVKPPPMAASAPAPAILPFKCPIPTCEFEHAGFATQQEADSHAKEVHNFAGDELEWCLEMLRGALDLDKGGQPKRTVGVAQTPSLDDKINAPLPNETPAQAWKRQQAARAQQHLAPPSLTTNKPKTLAGGSNQAASAKPPSKINPLDAWKSAKVQCSQLHHLFSNLEDFPSASGGLASFAGLNTPAIDWGDDPPGQSIGDMIAAFTTSHPSEAQSPTETVRVRIEEYNPFPEHGGTDYTAKKVELIRDERPFVACDPEEALREIMSPEGIARVVKASVEGQERKRKEARGLVSESALERFLRGDCGGKGKEDAGCRGEGEEGTTPPKRMKMSPVA